MTTEGIWAALAAVQRELRTQPHTREVSVGKYSYTYTELSALSDYLLPILGGAGISVTYTSEPCGEASLRISCRLTHSDGSHVVASTVIAPDGPDAQSVGKVLTYGRRYCLQMATGIATESDNDCAPSEAQHRPSASKARQPASDPKPSAARADNGAPEMLSDAQRRKIFMRTRELLSEGGATPTDDEVRAQCTATAQGMYEGRTVSQLSKRQASGLIEWLETANKAALTDDLPF